MVGGDGRFLVRQTAELIVKMAAANGVRPSNTQARLLACQCQEWARHRSLMRAVPARSQVKRVIVGQNGLMSTPAVSALVRARKATGTARSTSSHCSAVCGPAV